MIKRICLFYFLFSQLLWSESLYHISDAHKFIYFLIPKSGYTSLRTMIRSSDSTVSEQTYAKIDPALYPDYFKFSIVRNPWERALSCYKCLSFYKLPEKFFLTEKHSSFEDFLDFLAEEDVREKCCDFHIMSQSYLIPEGLDFIGRFENLEDDLKYVLSKLGMEHQDILHLNTTEHDTIVCIIINAPNKLLLKSIRKISSDLVTHLKKRLVRYQALTKQSIYLLIILTCGRPRAGRQ